MSADRGPAPSGLARSLRRLFDDPGFQAGGGTPTAGLLPAAARERLTNRLVRYLRGDDATRAALRDDLREDVERFLAAGEAKPLAEAALALASAGSRRDGPPDPLLPVLLAPQVVAELHALGTPRAREVLEELAC